jgi:hypothetical protein
MFNPQPIYIRLTRKELLELSKYLFKCKAKGFVEGNDYYTINKEREFMYQWHLNEISFRIYSKHYKKVIDRKQYSIKVTEIEKKTLLVMFQRVDCSPFMLELQKKLIQKLKTL